MVLYILNTSSRNYGNYLFQGEFMRIRRITLYDIELDNGQGKQTGHLEAEISMNHGEPEFWSNVSFIPFDNNANELPMQVIKPENLPTELRQQMLDKAERI